MIVSAAEMVAKARREHYAIGAFNTNNLEWTKCILTAAEEAKAPVMIQCSEGAAKYMGGFKVVADLVRDLHDAMGITVPVAIHLDHGTFEGAKACIEAGFTSVMFDGAALPFEENVRVTRLVTRIAKAAGVDVEAELGKVGDSGVDTADVFTDVAESVRFVEETGVDALAVAIGNLHGHYVHTPQLNIARLTEIHEANRLPLVLHGGSGTSVEDFKACIHNGICKINGATAIQRGIMKSIGETLRQAPDTGYIPLKQVMTDASRSVVADHIRLFESDGKAL